MLARVVEFSDVSDERIENIRQRAQSEGPPEGVEATELILLRDGERALAIMLFDSDDAYDRSDKTLMAMPDDEVPGTRQSVTKYDVAVRASA